MKKQNDNYDTYEKMTNIFLLCREIAQVTAIYKKFIEKIPNRNAKEITVIFDRLFFDYIIINWAKICGSFGESLHYHNVFKGTLMPPDEVKNNFLLAMNYTNEDYEKMHTHLLTWRDKLLAHFDFKDAYDLRYENYFNKIEIQCESIAQSTICYFEKEAKKNQSLQCWIPAIPKNKTLQEISSDLKSQWHTFPLGISEAQLDEIIRVLHS